ncbi:MAG: MFS transporter [Victivallales bacterium]|nr:MFS transporter [Victivallales bacterium]
MLYNLKKKKKWLITAIFFCVFAVQLDTNIIYIALPSISKFFGISLRLASWLIILYQLVISGSVLLIGKLGDLYNTKKIFILGLTIFFTGLCMCVFSFNFYFLILSRCITALGTSTIAVLTPVIIVKNFNKNEVGKIFGIRTSAVSLAIGSGALIGGLLVYLLGWKWIFIINMPICLTAMILLIAVLPEDIKAEKELTTFKFDYSGLIFSTLFIISLLYIINISEKSSLYSNKFLYLCAASITFFVLFIISENRAKYPLINISLFKIPAFTYECFMIFLVFVVIAGISFMLPFYLIDIINLHPGKAGAVMSIAGITSIFTGYIIGKKITLDNSSYYCFLSVILMCFLYIFLDYVFQVNSLILVIIFLFMLGLINPIFITSYIPNILKYSTEHNKSSISALAKFVVRIGMATGVCLFATVFRVTLPGDLAYKNLSSLSIAPENLLIPGFENISNLSIICCLIISLGGLLKKYFSR